jgi:acetyltransferase
MPKIAGSWRRIMVNPGASARAAETKGLWAADLTTRNGIKLHVRPGQPADVDLLADLFAHVSAEDLHFRFIDTVEALGRDRLAALLDAAQGMVTYIAFDEGGCAVACCTLAEDRGSHSAEVSLSVRSDWKGRGVSWTLLEQVLACAAARGLRRVNSLECPDDREAINLQREMGFVARLRSADPIEIRLSKAVEPSCAADGRDRASGA